MRLNASLNQSLDLFKISFLLLYTSSADVNGAFAVHPAQQVQPWESVTDNRRDLGDQTSTFPLVVVACLCETQGQLEVKALRQQRSKVCVVCLVIFRAKLLFTFFFLAFSPWQIVLKQCSE